MAGRGMMTVSANSGKVYFTTEAGESLSGLFAEAIGAIANENTRRDAAKFLSSFKAFSRSRDFKPADVDAGTVSAYRDFLADNGHTASYIAKRLQNFRSLYRRLVKEGRALPEPAGCFDSVGSDHPAGNPAARKSAGKSVVAALSRMARMPIKDPAIAATRDALLSDILSAGNDVAEKDDRGGLSSDTQLIMRSAGISFDTSATDIATELWIRAARECGIPAADIAAVCGNIPEGYAENLVSQNGAGADHHADRNAILSRVSAAILGNHPEWYAVRIHTGSDDATVGKLLAADERLARVRPYAPVEQLVVRKGKRLRATTVERIRHVMFLRVEPALIVEAAKAIAPAASVYRQTRAPGAPFARIPRREMENFRILLGEAPDDIEVTDNTTGFSEGTMVEITGGPFAGYRGRVITSGTRRLLTVALTSDFGLRVTASIPDPYLQVIK